MAPTAKGGVSPAGYKATALLGTCLAAFAFACCGFSNSSDSSTYTAVGEPCNSSRLFAADSVWNACFPADAPVDPRSTDMVRGLLEEVGREQAAGTGPYVQTDAYSTPLYVAGKHQPVVRVSLDDPHEPGRRGLQRAFSKVPISGTRDRRRDRCHMTVWQPSRDRLWELAGPQGSTAAGARAGAARSSTSAEPRLFDARSWPRLSRSNWGATATSLPVIAGTILVRELRAGQINHALALGLPAPRAESFAWPAQRTDGTGPPDAIPEGARLRLDPDLNLDSLGLPPITLMMARAAQRYGMIVRDQTHAAIGFYAQDPVHAKRGPYSGRMASSAASLRPGSSARSPGTNSRWRGLGSARGRPIAARRAR